MKRSVNLSHSAAGDRRNAGKHLVEAMRALGMTDAEIREALAGSQLAATPAAPGELVSGQPGLEQAGSAESAASARGS